MFKELFDWLKLIKKILKNSFTKCKALFLVFVNKIC